MLKLAVRGIIDVSYLTTMGNCYVDNRGYKYTFTSTTTAKYSLSEVKNKYYISMFTQWIIDLFNSFVGKLNKSILNDLTPTIWQKI